MIYAIAMILFLFPLAAGIAQMINESGVLAEKKKEEPPHE